MGQVTIYLDDDLEKKMRSAAKGMHLSQSKWIAGIIKERISNEWPESITKLAGSWQDLPTVEEMRNGLGDDAVREEL
jgi:hypothetical protein